MALGSGPPSVPPGHGGHARVVPAGSVALYAGPRNGSAEARRSWLVPRLANDGLRPLDLVLAVNNLGMWPDPPAQLRRILPLLRPGGRLAIGTQPRSASADAEMARQAAEQTAALLADAGFDALLADAGFDALETRSLALDPPMMLVIGTRP